MAGAVYSHLANWALTHRWTSAMAILPDVKRIHSIKTL